MKSYSGEHNILFYSDTREPLHIIFGGLIIKIVWYLERLISLHGLAGDGGKGVGTHPYLGGGMPAKP